MQKNKKTYIILIIYLLIKILIISIIPTTSYGIAIGKVYLEANKNTIENEETIEITVNIENSKTAAYNANIYFDETKLEYISGPENTNMIGNQIITLWYDEQGGSGAKEGQLSKFVFKAKEEGIANLTITGEFYNESGQLIETELHGTQIQIGKEETNFAKETKQEKGTNEEKSNAKLQTIRINQEGLTPIFDSETYNYYLTVTDDIKEIEILLVTQNPNATASIIGNTNLKEGVNTIQIQVISEDKSNVQNYNIEVTKTKNLELANTNLEILAIENTLLNPVYDNLVTKYNAEISNETNALNILAIPENEKATVQISGKDNLVEGNNTVLVDITAENGFTKKQIEVKVYKRNEEEEKQYQEKQSQMQDKIEEGYQIEKLSTEYEKDIEEQNNKIRMKIIIPLIIGIIGTSAIAIIIYFKRARIKKN